jgi:CBS domain-containing protein
MTTAREIMHKGAECVRRDDTLTAAAAMMGELHVGALPILGADDRLHGIITDRDIVVRGVGKGLDPRKTTVDKLSQGTPISVDASADVNDVLQTMEQHKVRRLPVIENERVVGVISEADLATRLGARQVSAFASSVYSAPPNN